MLVTGIFIKTKSTYIICLDTLPFTYKTALCKLKRQFYSIFLFRVIIKDISKPKYTIYHA